MKLDFHKLTRSAEKAEQLGKSGSATLSPPVHAVSENSGNARGTEIASVDAGVLTVPTVPTENAARPSHDAEAGLLPWQDPTCWSDDWSRWALECCLFRDRDSGGVKSLHNHFCEWCNGRELVPCHLAAFMVLVDDEGFLGDSGMVHGLVLKEDREPFCSKVRAREAGR